MAVAWKSKQSVRSLLGKCSLAYKSINQTSAISYVGPEAVPIPGWLIGGGDVNHAWLKSYDGETFTDLVEESGFTTQITAIGSNGEYYLVADRLGHLKKYDGETWTDLTAEAGFNTRINFIKWNGQYWLIGADGEGARNLVKYDGTTFTNLSSQIGVNYYLTDADWNGSYWIIVGYEKTNGTSSMPKVFKYDGATFTDLSDESGFGDYSEGRQCWLWAVKWNGSYFLIGGGYDHYTGTVWATWGMLKKYDGTTWTDVTSDYQAVGGKGTIYTIGWNGSYFLIGGICALKRYDGETFISLEKPPATNYTCIDWNGKYWLITEYNYPIIV